MMDYEENDPVSIWLAYSDLFSGVLVLVFALLLFQLFPQTIENGEGEDKELQRRRDAQWTLMSKLFDEIKAKGYTATPDNLDQVKERFNDKNNFFENLVKFNDENGNEAIIVYKPEGEEQRITFGSQVLFENKGPYLKEIKPEGIALLQSIGPSILIVGSRSSEIRVIGHTDVKPSKETDSMKYNWILSAERAIAVVTELLTDPVIGEKLSPAIKDEYNQYRRGTTTLNFPPNQISAIGRGEFEPLGSTTGEKWNERKKHIYASWDDEAAMKGNRRIELVIRFLPLSQRDSE